MNLRFPLALLGFVVLPLWLNAQPKIELQDFATGFNRPVDITHCGDSRIFVVEQRGYIWVLDSLGNRLPDPFLNIDPKVNSSGNEQGLLGLAFHPNFAQNGWFYLNYTQNNGDSRMARYSVSANNPNLADPNSEVVLFDVDQPYSNHNGGCIKFGPDGMLYISFGDGGSGGDPQNNGQKKSTHLGKILRIDVNSNTSPYYTVPPDNPFVNDPAYKPEIWSLGLRNVWRFSIDRLTGDLWLADVGQDAREEVNFEPANTPGRNYGWRCYEGTNTYNTNGCLGASNYTQPVFQYTHTAANGCSITGGFVYRGNEYPDLYGHYLVTDYCSGRWWNLFPDGNGGFTSSVLANLNAYDYSAYGEDRDGRLFVAGLSSGKIFKIKELCSAFQVASVSVIEPACDGTANGSITPNLVGTTGNVTFVWSNGATSSTLTDLLPGSYTATITNGNGCSRTSTVELVATNTNLPVPVLQLDSGSTPLLCSNGSVEIEVAANPFSFAYQWYRDGQPIPNGPTGASITVTEPGTYTAQFVNPPCVSPLSNAVEVSALGVPEVGVLAGSLVLCNSDTVLLGASAPPANDFNYQWFVGSQPIAGATGATLTVTQPGAYSVQWTRPGTACESSLSNVQNVDSEVSLPFFVGFEAGTLFVGDGGGNPPFQWYLNGQPIPGATDDTYVPTVSGYYEVFFTSPNGCVYSDGLDVTVSRTQDPASVQRCTLTPNPTSGQVRLEVGLKKAATAILRLTDAQGRQLRTFSLSGTTLVQSLDLSNLPAATYFLVLELPDGRLVREVVKK